MKKIKLISDSSCDLNAIETQAHNIEIVPFSVSFDDVIYLKENVDITIEEFYKKLEDDSAFAKTSLPSVNLYLEAFESAVKEDLDVICVTISSKFSGSYQSAINAKNIILEDYPDAKIEIIDSLLAAYAQGEFVLFANKLIDKGLSLEEIVPILLENRKNSVFYLTVSTLKYLQKGGRIGKAQALAGELLNVVPVIAMTNGELVSMTKVRGMKKASSTLNKLALEFVNNNNYDINECSSYVLSCNADVSNLTKKLEEDGFTNVISRQVGVTITAHTGTSINAIGISRFTE